MTDCKQLCAELVELGSSPARSVSELAERMSQVMDLADRARAALAEPEPEEPTDEELADTYWTAWHEHLDRTNSVLHTVGLRAVLARWGK